MSRLVVIPVLIFIAIFRMTTSAEELYSDKYDYIDAGPILANERSRRLYYNCFMGNAPCLTPDAKFFKETFPEALVTKCVRCTERQKINFEKIVLYYTQYEPEKWKAILAKSIQDIQKSKPSRH